MNMEFQGKIRSLKELSSELRHLIKSRLWLKVIIGMVLGIGVGFALGPSAGWVDPKIADTITHWLALPGNLFLGMVKMIVIPLIVASIIIGITSSGDFEQLRKMGLYIVLYFVVTTSIAITIGMGAAWIVNPGQYVDIDPTQYSTDASILQSDKSPTFSLDHFPDELVKLLPENPLSSMVSGELLGVVIFTVIVGLALVTMKRSVAEPLINLLAGLQEVCITIVRWAMVLVPFAVFGLMTRLTSTTGFETLKGMGVYVLTVLGALLVLMAFYLLIVTLIGRKNPLRFLSKVKDVQLLAFSTSSSAAVMPTSIKTAEDKLGVSPSISKFIIPVGATINMDGTALYQGAATVFLAQVFGVELSIAVLALLVVTTTMASIGAPAAPGVGIVILATILESVGIPGSGVALIISVDRILDMSRTAVNVTGDLTASVVFDRWFGKGSDAAAGRKPAVSAVLNSD